MVIAVILLTIALIVLTVINLMRARVAEKEVVDLRNAIITVEERVSACEAIAHATADAQAANEYRFKEVEQISADSLRQCEHYKNYIYRYIGDPDATEN